MFLHQHVCSILNIPITTKKIDAVIFFGNLIKEGSLQLRVPIIWGLSRVVLPLSSCTIEPSKLWKALWGAGAKPKVKITQWRIFRDLVYLALFSLQISHGIDVPYYVEA